MNIEGHDKCDKYNMKSQRGYNDVMEIHVSVYVTQSPIPTIHSYIHTYPKESPIRPIRIQSQLTVSRPPPQSSERDREIERMACLSLVSSILLLLFCAAAGSTFDDSNPIRLASDGLRDLEAQVIQVIGHTKHAFSFARFAHRCEPGPILSSDHQ